MVFSWQRLCSRRGLEEDWEGLLRPGRRLRESERNGGGGGRLDLRREMLRVTAREYEEEPQCFLFSWFNKIGVLIFSEHRELLSVLEGEERPEESRGSKFQPSIETHLMSWVRVVQSPSIWLLWILELGERV